MSFSLNDPEPKSSKQINLDMVYLDLEKALKSNQSKHNLVLNEGDSIIIPKTMDVVHITGELMNLQGNSISAPYFSSKRANYYVKNFAGGFSKLNDRSNTVVVYPNGIAKKSKNFLFFKLSPKVSKGSTIRVSSKIKKGKRKNKGKIDSLIKKVRRLQRAFIDIEYSLFQPTDQEMKKYRSKKAKKQDTPVDEDAPPEINPLDDSDDSDDENALADMRPKPPRFVNIDAWML